MTKVFLWGVLTVPQVAMRLFGAMPQGCDAELPGYHVTCTLPTDDPTLSPDQTGSVHGLITALDGTNIKRLAFYGAAIGHSLTTVQIGDNVVTTLIGRPRGAKPWQANEWAGHGAAMTLGALKELMLQFGQSDDAGLAVRYTMMRARVWSTLLAKQQAHAKTLAQPPKTAQVQVKDRRAVYQGFFRYDTAALHVPQYGGGMGGRIDREIYVGVDAALILPYDPTTDAVVMIEQFRCGPWGRGDPEPWSLEPVAGLVDPGETPQQTAHREGAEETGLRFKRLEQMTGVYASPGYTTDYFHCFLGLCSLDQRDHWIGGKPEEHENIRSHMVSYDRAMDMVDSGEINVGPLVMMLLWLARHRDRIRCAYV